MLVTVDDFGVGFVCRREIRHPLSTAGRQVSASDGASHIFHDREGGLDMANQGCDLCGDVEDCQGPF